VCVHTARRARARAGWTRAEPAPARAPAPPTRKAGTRLHTNCPRAARARRRVPRRAPH
jgi:hypothetical protein